MTQFNKMSKEQLEFTAFNVLDILETKISLLERNNNMNLSKINNMIKNVKAIQACGYATDKCNYILSYLYDAKSHYDMSRT
jgi:hypothetical protein